MEELIFETNEEYFNEYDDLDILKTYQNKIKTYKDFIRIEDYYDYLENKPTNTPHHPKLLDYNWVYANALDILFNSKLEYQEKQGKEEYIFFFKVITQKYSLEEDYLKYLRKEIDINYLYHKWGNFLERLINFINTQEGKLTSQIFQDEYVKNYFQRYLEFMEYPDFNFLKNINITVLEQEPFTILKKEPEKIVAFMNNKTECVLNNSNFSNPSLVKYIARSIDTNKFYYNLWVVGKTYDKTLYLEEQQKFLEEQIKGSREEVIPYFQKDLTRPKLEYYQKLSLHYLKELVISSLFACTYYNLLVDMETLVLFARKHQILLEGMNIYEFLIAIDDKSYQEIIDFYEKYKKGNLQEMFYDDWQKAKALLVKEINKLALKPQKLKSSKSYYDITLDKHLLIEHTEYILPNLEIDKSLEELKRKIEKGDKEYLSLSIQDEFHHGFYESLSGIPIIFLYGALEENRVGTVYHEDVYSNGLQDVEIENTKYIRRLYTLEELMQETKDFNEIVYAINSKPFVPFGILVEEINDLYKHISKVLNLPLFLRKETKEKQIKTSKYNPRRIRKKYDNFNNYLGL